jgi:hypothetical protein
MSGIGREVGTSTRSPPPPDALDANLASSLEDALLPGQRAALAMDPMAGKFPDLDEGSLGRVARVDKLPGVGVAIDVLEPVEREMLAALRSRAIQALTTQVSKL